MMGEMKNRGPKPVGKPDQFFQIFDFRIYYQFDKNSSSLATQNFGGVCIASKTDPINQYTGVKMDFLESQKVALQYSVSKLGVCNRYRQ